MKSKVHVSRHGSIDIGNPTNSQRALLSSSSSSDPYAYTGAAGASSSVKDLQEELNEVIAELAQGSLNKDLATRLQAAAAPSAASTSSTSREGSPPMQRSYGARAVRAKYEQRSTSSSALTLSSSNTSTTALSPYRGERGSSSDSTSLVLRRRLDEKSRAEAELLKRVQVDKVRLLSLEDQLEEEAEGSARAQRLYGEERANAQALRTRVGEAERSQRSQEKLVTRLQTDVRQLTSSVEEKRVSEERLETRTRELEDELRTLRHRFVTMQVKHSEAEQKLSLGATDRAAMEQEFRAQETSLTMLRSESATEATRLRAQLTSDAEEGTRAQKQLAQSEETVATLRARLRTLSEDAAQERRALELRARDASRSLSTLRSDNNALVASEQDALALAARHEQQAAAHAEQLETIQVELNALARSHASFESQNGLLCDRLEEKTRAALESAQTIAELRAALELAQTDGAGGSQDDRLRAERRARKDAATIASLRARVEARTTHEYEQTAALRTAEAAVQTLEARLAAKASHEVALSKRVATAEATNADLTTQLSEAQVSTRSLEEKVKGGEKQCQELVDDARRAEQDTLEAAHQHKMREGELKGEIETVNSQLERANGRVADLERKVDAAVSAESKLRLESSDAVVLASERLRETESAANDLKIELERREKANEEFEERCVEYENAISVLEGSVEQGELRVEGLEKRIASMRPALHDLEGKLSERQDTEAELALQLQQAQHDAADSQTAAEIAQREVAAITKRLDAERSSTSVLRQDLADAKAEASDARALRTTVETQVALLSDRVESVQSELTKAQTREREALREVAALQQELSQASATSSSSRAAMGPIKEERARFEMRVKELERELDELHSVSEQTRGSLELRVSEASAQHAQLTSALATAQASATGASGRARSVEAEAAERIAALERELREQSASLSRLQTYAEEKEKVQRSVVAQVEAAESSTTMLRAELTTLKTQHRDAVAKLAREKKDSFEARLMLEDVQDRLAASESSLESATHQVSMLKSTLDENGTGSSKLVESVQLAEERAIRAETALEQRTQLLQRTTSALETQKQTVMELREGLIRHSEISHRAETLVTAESAEIVRLRAQIETRQLRDERETRQGREAARVAASAAAAVAPRMSRTTSPAARAAVAAAPAATAPSRHVHISRSGTVHIDAPTAAAAAAPALRPATSSSSSSSSLPAPPAPPSPRASAAAIRSVPRVHVSRRGSITIAPSRLPVAAASQETVRRSPPRAASPPPPVARPSDLGASRTRTTTFVRTTTTTPAAGKAKSRRVGRTPVRMKAFRAIFEAVDSRGVGKVTGKRLVAFLHSPAMTTPGGTNDAKVNAGLRVRQRFCALLTAGGAIENILSSEGVGPQTLVSGDEFSEYADRVFMG